MKFRMECSFVQADMSKLQDKSPLKQTVAQKLSCLNPKTLATDSCEDNVSAFKVLV